MAPTYFPLRWESTRDQWWYASPIDWAAANGHYDLVRELLRIDNNHLFKLTSLRRIRRLETVWDDEAQFHDVAKFRSQVARKLLLECESNKGKNSLIGAGYGGWLMYTAASAGDLDFVRELLERDPLLVFGEGEYGVTDIFYAAARSKSCEVFRVIYNFAVSPRFKGVGEFEDERMEVPAMYKQEMINRAIHAAARGGNLVILKELLTGSDDVLSYRDVNGSTLLHAAAGKGQVEVVKHLMEFDNLVSSTDHACNTALHLAAHKGQLDTVRLLLSTSPTLASLRNNAGETFLHMSVSGFQSPAFHRLDRQMELVKELTDGCFFNIEDVINVRNNNGQTPLHMAILGNIHAELVELLMTVRSINVNVRDNNGMTPLDLLKQRPQTASSDILIRQLISAGGMFSIESKDFSARRAIVSHLKMQGCGGSSPGTNFGVSDNEILLYTGIDNPSPFDASDPGSSFDLTNDHSCSNKKSGSVIKKVFHWPRTKDKGSKKSGSSEEIPTPVPLRRRFSKASPSLPNNKRTLSVRSNISSPTNRKKLATGLRQGVIETMPHIDLPRRRTPSGSFSRSSVSSTPTSVDKQKGLIFFDQDFAGPSYSHITPAQDDDTPRVDPKRISFGKRLRAQYFCFGGPSLSVKKPISKDHINPTYKCPVPSVA